MKKILAAVPCACVLAACATGGAEPAGKAPELADRSLMWADGASEECEVPPSVSFAADGRISGMTGCNNLLGSWTLEGKKIAFPQLGSTRRMCGPALMKVEDTFLKHLNATVYMTADGENVLCWNKDGKLEMTLVPETAGKCH